MPVFTCLGQSFEISVGDLAKAPNSILAEAWSTSTKQSAVSLDDWPQPDLELLKVGLSGLVTAEPGIVGGHTLTTGCKCR